MYVLHYPILIGFNALGITFARLLPRVHSVALAATIIVVVNAATTTVASFITWHLLEQPILRLKERFPYVKGSGIASPTPRLHAKVAQD
jgi:peptidoglycan/LPS O-acetylase OafA/YrhL